MVDIIPFKGLVYDLDSIKEISKVLAPPYDIISETERLGLKESSRYNIVNLTLPESTRDSSGYENATKLLKSWIQEGILTYESEDCFYLIKETFKENNKNKCFTGFVGLLRLEEYGEGKVLRHEKTLPKPKEDRLNLLKACRTNLEFIYTLYNDHNNKVTHILNKYLDTSPLVSTSVNYDPELNFALWKIREKNIKDEIIAIMREKTLLIADGHHRYETSRLYREMSGKEKGSREDYILALFVSSNQEDIIIHPTHRLINFEEKTEAKTLIRKLENYFEINIPESIEIKDINNMMRQSYLKNDKSFLICFPDGLKVFITLKKPFDVMYDRLKIDKTGFDEEFEYLDVNILHRLILENIFSDNEIKNIRYVHTIKEVLEALENKNNGYDIGVILNAPTVSTVENLSNRNKIMPQKSTYFFPKPCSGLVLYKFDSK